MPPGQLLHSALSLLVQGSSSGWFGLACPGHCQGSFAWTFASCLVGFLLGVLTTIIAFRHLLLSVPASAWILALSPLRLEQSIVDLQRALERLRIAVGQQSDSSHAEWEVVSSSGEPPSSSVGVSSSPPSRTRARGTCASTPLTRASIAASFPACPRHCLDLCDRLSPTAPLQPEERAIRAWKAGCWAKAVFEGQVPTPAPTPVLNLKPACYIVLRCARLPSPARFSTWSAFRAAVGPLSDPSAIASLPFVRPGSTAQQLDSLSLPSISNEQGRSDARWPLAGAPLHTAMASCWWRSREAGRALPSPPPKARWTPGWTSYLSRRRYRSRRPACQSDPHWPLRFCRCSFSRGGRDWGRGAYRYGARGLVGGFGGN